MYKYIVWHHTIPRHDIAFIAFFNVILNGYVIKCGTVNGIAWKNEIWDEYHRFCLGNEYEIENL